MITSQYLDKYAEPEIRLLPEIQQTWRHCVVIPAFNEPPKLLQALLKIATVTERLLVLLVLNRPETVNQVPANDQLAEAIDGQLPKHWQSECSRLKCYELGDQEGALLLIDRWYHGDAIPVKRGVGLARKIGSDIAHMLIQQGSVQSNWIHTTDADTYLPVDYFNAATQVTNPNAAALVYPFKHVVDPKESVGMATALYEFSLHYYVAGLHWSNSPYAYNTIGSALAIESSHYALVRGFPPRAGGEDFYLLNKLAKTGEILSLAQPTLSIAARQSDRVPFGTGPAVANILSLNNPVEEYRYYHPQCFTYLKTWLDSIPSLWRLHNESPDLSINDLITQSLNIHDTLSKSLLNSVNDHLHESLLINTLTQLNIKDLVQHALIHSNEQRTFIQHMHHGFDGFKTLKFIHCLEQQGLKKLSLTNLINSAHPLLNAWNDNHTGTPYQPMQILLDDIFLPEHNR